jgi:hypothetical protein
MYLEKNFSSIFGDQNTGSGSALTKNAESGSALKPMWIHNTAFHTTWVKKQTKQKAKKV